MQKSRKNHPRKSHQTSFQVTNNVIQLPDYLDKQKIVSRQALRIVTATDNNLFPQKVSKLAKESSTLKAVINSFAEYVSYGVIATENPQLERKLTKDLNKYYDWFEFSKRVAKDRERMATHLLKLSVKVARYLYII